MFTENEQNSGEEDFSALLEKSLDRSDNFYPGDQVEGTIVQINDDNILVDIAGKSEAVIDIREFIDEHNNITININDTINAFIVSTSKGEIQLTKSIGKGFVNHEILDLAFKQEIPLQGTVFNKINGGFLIKISNYSCFCPFSQIDIKKNEDDSQYLNKTYSFKIIEFKNDGKNIIVSRRALLEKILQDKEAELRKTLKIGDIIEGIVSKSLNFGIFVDIGGIDALVPRSELNLSKLVKPEDFKTGTIINAKIINLDWDNKKISLSIRQTMPDPWENIKNYNIQESYSAIITNLIPKGAFAQIVPGLEGFIPISKMSYLKKINKPEDILTSEQKVKVKIIEIDKSNKKILLELNTGEEDPWQDENLNNIEDEIHNATIESKNNYGLNIRLNNGIKGFVPGKELLNNLANDYNEADKIKTCIIKIKTENQELIASEKAAEKLLEKKEYLKHMRSNDDSNTSSLGSRFNNIFADLKKNIK